MRKNKKCIFEAEHEEMGKNIEYCISCKAKIGKSYNEKMDDIIKKIPIETKQKFMNGIKEGITVGEARLKVGLSTEIATHILYRQIKTTKYTFLDFEINQNL